MTWLRPFQLLSAAVVVFIFMLLSAFIGWLGQGSEDEGVFSSNDIDIPSALEYSPEDFSDIRASFEQFKRKKKSSKSSKEKTAEELAAERAAAKERIDKTLRPNFAAFDEEHQIGLVGIFEQKGTFAVLQVINYETKNIEYKQLREKDVFSGYMLVSVKENSVKLNNGERELNLVLFKRLNG